MQKAELKVLIQETERRVKPGLVRASVVKLNDLKDPTDLLAIGFVVQDALDVILDELVVQLHMHEILRDVFEIETALDELEKGGE